MNAFTLNDWWMFNGQKRQRLYLALRQTTRFAGECDRVAAPESSCHALNSTHTAIFVPLRTSRTTLVRRFQSLTSFAIAALSLLSEK